MGYSRGEPSRRVLSFKLAALVCTRIYCSFLAIRLFQDVVVLQLLCHHVHISLLHYVEVDTDRSHLSITGRFISRAAAIVELSWV